MTVARSRRDTSFMRRLPYSMVYIIALKHNKSKRKSNELIGKNKKGGIISSALCSIEPFDKIFHRLAVFLGQYRERVYR